MATRSPFTGATGATGDDNPTVFAGFIISNSEVGAGAFTITPQLVVQVCDNGMTITKDVQRAVHVGSRMAEGLIRWSDDTREKEIALIRSRTKDAVRTFLDIDYVTRTIAGLEETAGKPITGADKVVRTIGKKLAFAEEHNLRHPRPLHPGWPAHRGRSPPGSHVLPRRPSPAPTSPPDVEAQGVKAMELAAAM
ncbi:hypothetical protein ACFPJ1_12060 [Kribbella qitaiheensis]|uniref:hypothetical protein n=1 Tax=Kribbella qitaiheensis TaxID=1544730 RepID=UPI00361D25C8